MTQPVLLTGGTGTLGRLVAPRLLSAGYEVRVLTRTMREPDEGVEYAVGDLATGAGIDKAMTDIETIIHCAGSAKGDEVKAHHLVEAALRVGSPHVVYISVVGADRVPVRSGLDRAAFGYYAAKLAAERVIADSALPWTTLRATQFHDLLLTMVSGMAKMPVAPYFSGFRFQPVDADEVAARLVELALAKPAGLVPELGGPEVRTAKQLTRSYLTAAGKHRLTMPIRVAGNAARAMRAGANLTPDQTVGKRTWEAFLAERFS